jgi:hypothetical protein
LFSQGSPIELHERVLLGDFANHFVRNSRAVSQASQMQLPHFIPAAHAVHQVEEISFAADKSHDVTPNSRRFP